MTIQDKSNQKVKFYYTATVTDAENGLISEQYKGEGPQKHFDGFVGIDAVGVQNAYTKSLEYYDGLVYNWLKTFEILDADKKNVISIKNIVMDTPEKLFSVDDRGTGSMTGRVMLPAINVTEGNFKKVLNRGNVLATAQRRKRQYFDDENKNYVEVICSYHQIDLSYDITLWAKTKTEMQMLIEQLFLPFQPEAFFYLSIPDIYFEEVIQASITDLNRSTAIDPDGERLLRADATLFLQAFIPVGISKIEKTIKDVVLEFTQTGVQYDDSTLPVYLFEQKEPRTQWTVCYTLIGSNPSVAVIDDNNQVMLNVQLEKQLIGANNEYVVKVNFNDGLPRTGKIFIYDN